MQLSPLHSAQRPVAPLLATCLVLCLSGCTIVAKAQAQIVGADGRVQSGVTFTGGDEKGPELALRGNFGLAVWYEDGSEPIHCAFSLDGGASWSPGGLLPDDYNYGQPAVCAGPGASFHAVNVRDLPFSSTGLVVRRGVIEGGALTWQPSVQLDSAQFIERPTIACDPTSADVYVTYTRTFLVSAPPIVYSASIYFARSSDGGATWSAPVALSPATCHGSQVVVGPDGEVVVVWQDFASAQVMVRRSVDRGASFGPERVVGAILENANTAPPGVGRAGPRRHTTWPYSMLAPHYPVVAVDRSPGSGRRTLYVAWPEMASGPVGPHLGNTVEVEPNGFFATATPVQVGWDLIGSVPSTDHFDSDWWAFEGTAGQTVAMTGSYDYFPLNPFGLEIDYSLIYCGQDTLQYFVLGRGFATGAANLVTPPMVFTLPYTGRYYIGLGGLAGPGYSISYRYQLRTVQVEAGSVARDHRDVVLVRSSDGGQSWSGKVRVSGGPAGFDDIVPALAVDDVGQVHAAWYGREDDPTCGYLANTYWTVSRDRGQTFLAPQRVSGVGTDWRDGGDGRAAGDRLGLATVGTRAQLLWMDGRNYAANSMDIYGAAVEAGGPTATVIGRFVADPVAQGIRLSWTIEEAAGVAGFRLERAREAGGWEELAIELPKPGSGQEYVAVDAGGVAGERYRYRLEVRMRQGGSLWAGPVEATWPGASSSVPSLRTGPNPATGPVAIALTLPGPQEVSLAIYDVAGKQVALLHEGRVAAGTLALEWSGRTSEGRQAPPGLYWVRAQLAGVQLVRRLARIDY